LLFKNNLNRQTHLPHFSPLSTQITLWDYVRYDVHEFLGEVVIDLHNHPLDDEPEWYMLQPHQEFPGAVRIHFYLFSTPLLFLSLKHCRSFYTFI
jgi:hypothetical protein